MCGLVFLAGTSVFVAACDGSSGDTQLIGTDRVSEPSVITEELARACTALAASERIAVLCPTWLPSTRTGAARYAGFSVSQADFERGECQYLTQIGYSGHGSGRTVPFHILFGGRCEPFPLKTRQGRWPARGNRVRDLRLTNRVGNPGRPDTIVRPKVVGRATVRRRPALVLQVAPYPDGGIHGGHYAIVWNRGDAGYALSLHYSRDGGAESGGSDGALPPRRADVRALVRGARSMTLVPAPND